MVTSQGKSPDTSSGSHPGLTDVPDGGGADGGDFAGGRAWVPPEALRKAETELAPGEEDQDDGTERRPLTDQFLVQVVLDQGLDGPLHQALDHRLISYAVPVLKWLVANDQIRVRCRQLGRPVRGLNGLNRFTSHDLDDFVQEMVIRALPMFTEAVFIDRRWSPEGGATLRTYFINGCIRQFPDIYRKWLRELQRYVPQGLDPDPDGTSRTPDPATVVADTDQAVQLMRQIPGPLREVVARRAIGYPAREAAADAGMTPKAAESQLGRFRKTLNEAAIPPGSARKKGTGGGHSDDTQEA